MSDTIHRGEPNTGKRIIFCNCQKFVIATLMAVGFFLPVSATPTAWWRMEGVKGSQATSIADVLHGRAFVGSAVSTGIVPEFTDEVRGEVVFETSDLEGTCHENAGSVHLNSSLLLLSSDDTSAVFPLKIDEANLSGSFTFEMFALFGGDLSKWGDLLVLKTLDTRHLNLAVQAAETADSNITSWQFRTDYSGDGVPNKVTMKSKSLRPIALNKWHHVALTYDADTKTFSLLVDYQVVMSEVWSYPLPILTGAALHLGKSDGNAFDLKIDEVRVSDVVLGVEEMMHPGRIPALPANFLYLLDNGSFEKSFMPVDSYDKAEPMPLSVNRVVGAPSGLFGTLVDHDGDRHVIGSSARFTTVSEFSITGQYFRRLEENSFTLESYLYPLSAIQNATIFSHDGVWNIGLDDGKLVLACGGQVVTLADEGAISPHAWHHFALVATRSSDGIAFNVYVDGVEVGEVPATELQGPFVGALKFLVGWSGLAAGFRGSSGTLAPEDFLARIPFAGETLGYWSLDSDAAEGASTVGMSFPGLAGSSAFDLKGLATGSPLVSHDTPNRYVWQESSGKIFNAGNKSSLSFDGDNMGLVAAVGALDLPSDFTAEFFVKPTVQKSYGVIADFSMDRLNMSGYNTCWMVDLGSSGNHTRLRVDKDTGDNKSLVQVKEDTIDLLDGAWHHVAVSCRYISETGKYRYSLWVDYENMSCSDQDQPPAFNAYSNACLRIGYGNANARFTGLIDEFRLSTVSLESNEFMRAFEPRADLSAIWFAEGAVLSGREILSGTNYLTATWGSDVVVSSDTPKGAKTTYTVNGVKVGRTSISAACSGGAGILIPCCAMVGAESVTMECFAKGKGEVLGKGNELGRSWSCGVDETGVPYMKVGTKTQKAEFAVSGGWHAYSLTYDANTMDSVLYVDRVRVASIMAEEMPCDACDIHVGEGFTGNVSAVRFSPTVLSPEAFLKAADVGGLRLIFR